MITVEPTTHRDLLARALRDSLVGVGKEEAAEVLLLAGREVRVTHPSKRYFSQQAVVTKLDLVRYYVEVAAGALRGIRDRPIVLKRFVDGAEGEPFYQKRAPAQRPEWLRTVTLSFPLCVSSRATSAFWQALSTALPDI